ncbi:hypothetical protein [Streptomyces anulatus]|uniref:hypothetical protein n=1 Tax=Streptomyces anulatus TaxID=1892 RepID=UPI003447C7DF
MTVMESGFRLSEVDDETLADKTYTGLPVRLDARGLFTEPVDGVRIADVQFFLNSESLADLLAQGRALQLTLARKARLAAEAAVEAEMKREGASALREMADPDAERPDAVMLERLVDGLREMPAVSLRRQQPRRRTPEDPSVGRGGP